MSGTRSRAFTLSNSDFKFICDYVYNSSGIVLGESKREMVYRRLTRVVRERKLASFADYCTLLKANPESENAYFINAITTNLTSFYREKHHFDYLAKTEFPALLVKNKASKRIRLWSSASSTGEEPYSLAITTYQSFASYLTSWNIKILATDIDSNVLEVAKAGVYSAQKIDDVPVNIQKQFFKQGEGANKDKVKVSQKVKDLITFKQLNLLHDWPMTGKFDVVLCRNVIIYFDKPTQQELFERYYEILPPGGLLMLGHSENLGSFQRYFENVGRTIFRKPK
ncbi:CheR family methyltransferase [Colwellia sp. MEBiC06753]